MSDNKPMRSVFGEVLRELGSEFDKLVVLDADVSSSTQTKLFGDKFPDRFYNFGIAEANMISAAAGMAVSGLIPVASTFAFLIALRAADPVRSLIAYNNLNVKLAGGYAGLSDFADGASHQSVIDMSIMRAMPNMTVLAPSDIETTKASVRAMIEYEGPVYIRLSRDIVGSCHNGDESFTIGKAKVLREGNDVTIAVCGTPVVEAIKAADMLKEHDIYATVLEFITIKPFDSKTLLRYAQISRLVVTVEEHSVIGGFGGACCECLCEEAQIKVKRIGIRDTFGESGSYSLLLEKHGLTARKIFNEILKLMKP